MAKVGISKGSSRVSAPRQSPFVLGSRPPSLYAPRLAPRASGNILSAPPRIKPVVGQTQYGKPQPGQGVGFGNTGLTGES